MRVRKLQSDKCVECSVIITWSIRILSLSPAVCIQQSATLNLTITLHSDHWSADRSWSLEIRKLSPFRSAPHIRPILAFRILSRAVTYCTVLLRCISLSVSLVLYLLYPCAACFISVKPSTHGRRSRIRHVRLCRRNSNTSAGSSALPGGTAVVLNWTASVVIAINESYCYIEGIL